ncbi:MAG: HAMP domain-containing sensor histidine kinase, partial [archaeon]
MEEDSNRVVRGILFGSIRKKLNWAFGILIVLLVAMVLVTYSLNRQVESAQNALREVEAPIELMVQQVVFYDALLTENVHDAVLHALKGERLEETGHKVVYDKAGVKLDNLLKYDALALLNKSQRSLADKQKVNDILVKLDVVNLKLVDLEMGAFDALSKNDTTRAFSLVVSDEYDGYKAELAGLYKQWADAEAKVSEEYRQQILANAQDVQIYNLYLGLLFILIAIGVPIVINRNISKPISQLYNATQALERGNLSSRVQIKSGDELERLGEEFNKTAEQLGRVDEERKGIDKAKTEFLSITSHELRSPMTPMRAQLQMLDQNYFGKMNRKQKDALDIVLRNTERLDRILLDFLEVSRIEAARLKFNFAKTNLEKNIKSVVTEMKSFMPEKNLKILLNMGGLPIIECDPDRIMQVLRNLMNNAVKFSKPGGKIEVSVLLKGQFIEFIVKDDGMGIKKEDQSRLFEPFYQVGGMYDRKVGGTGLGLAICKGIVESQHGKIWLVSEYGRGTVFHFTVPLTPEKEMKPIKLLFSNKLASEDRIRKVLIEYLGPSLEDLRLFCGG